MFTGIVTEIGTIQETVPLRDGLRITVAASASFVAELHKGDSVAIDGVCQTVVDRDADTFVVQAIGTTLSRTTFPQFVPGRRVNLEPALALGERLGGHLVQGHVDGIGHVLSVQHAGEHVLLDVSLPPEVADVTVLHGSIAIDGVSLTVNALPAADAAQVGLIPYTWEYTNLNRLQVGDAVNLEGDMLGRFVVHFLKRREG